MRDDIEVIALELCEFCKSEPELRPWEGHYHLRCPGCSEMSATMRSPDDCAHHWNTEMRKIRELKVGKSKGEFEEFKKFFDKMGIDYDVSGGKAVRIMSHSNTFHFSDGVFVKIEDNHYGSIQMRVE